MNHFKKLFFKMKPIRIIIVALAFASLFTACNKQEPVTPESQLTGTSWKGSAVEGDGIDGVYELHLSFLNDATCALTGLVTGSPLLMGMGGMVPSGLYGEGRYTLTPSETASGTYRMEIDLLVTFMGSVRMKLEGDYTPGAKKLELTESPRNLFKKTSPVLFVLQ